MSLLFTPFIEAPPIRTVRATSGSGGSNISSFEHLAQGVSVRNPMRIATSVIPFMYAGGDLDSNIERLDFSSNEAFDPCAKFSDSQKIIPENLIQNRNQFGNTIFVGDYWPEDGVIEPLTIRNLATREIQEDLVPHVIKSSLMDGNINSFGESNVVSSFKEIKANSDFSLFKERYGYAANGLIILDGFIMSHSLDKIEIFSEVSVENLFLTSDTEINKQLLLMTGSIEDDFRKRGEKSAVCGFVYQTNIGTDSIAFGGLTYEAN